MARPTDEAPPLALLLLPSTLEEFGHAEHARDLLRAPRIVALEPPRVSWSAFGRMPEGVALGVGVRQAKRLKLPGRVRVVVVYHALQLSLAEGLLARSPGAELWCSSRPELGTVPAGAKARAATRVAERAADALALATYTFDPAAPDPSGEDAFGRNMPLWDRLEALGIAEFER